MMEKLPQTEQASVQEVIVPLGLEEQEAKKADEEFRSKYGVDKNKFRELLENRLQLFSDEANGVDGEKFKKDTEIGMLKFLEQKHILESATGKLEALQQERQRVVEKKRQEEQQLGELRTDLRLPPGTSVEVEILSKKAEDIVKETVENQKQMLAAKEGMIGGENLFNLTNDQIEDLDKNGVGLDQEDKALLAYERGLRAEHTEAVKPEKEFNSSQWVDDFSGFSENSNLTETEAEEALMVMKERFEELTKDEVFDRSEEIKNYENSIRNSELGKKYPDLVNEYVKGPQSPADSVKIEEVALEEIPVQVEIQKEQTPLAAEQFEDVIELEEDSNSESKEQEPVVVHEKLIKEIQTGSHLDATDKIKIQPKVAREPNVNPENDFEKAKFLKKVGGSITEEIIPRMSRFSRSLEDRSNERLAELLDDTDTGRLSKVFRNIGESFNVRSLDNKEVQDQLLRDIKNATSFFSQIDVLRPRTVKEDVESLIQLHRSLDQVANDINDLSRKVSNASLEQEGSNPGFLADLAKSLKNLSGSVEESPLSYEIRRRVRSLS